MRDPARSVVLGPLAPFAGGFVVELSAQGYTAGSAVQQMCLMAHLSRWLAAEGLGPAALSPAVVGRFFGARRAAGYTSLLSARALDSLLAYLRGVGVVPAPSVSVPDGPAEELLSRFRRYLEVERGLVAGSSRVYVHWVRPFVEGIAGEDGLDLAGVDAAAVRRFVVEFCAERSRRTTEVLIAALRVVIKAARRAGLGQVGAHRLRHAAASEMLRGGAGLPEIGQVLGHRAAATTAIYAKVDRDGLRQIARPWPVRSA